MLGFSLASLFPPRKQEAVTQSGTMEPEGQTARRGGEPREPVLSKAGRTSKNAGAFQIHTRKTRITQARAPLIPNN